MGSAGFTWVWSWHEHAVEDRQTAHYPDARDSRGMHWITVYSTGVEGWEDEICILPLYTDFVGWETMVEDRERKADMIVEALMLDLHAAGG